MVSEARRHGGNLRNSVGHCYHLGLEWPEAPVTLTIAKHGLTLIDCFLGAFTQIGGNTMASALAPPAAKPNAPQSGYHCRVHERQSCELPTSCQPAAAFGNAESKWSGVVRDISPGGLQLSLTRRFEPGTGLAVELARHDTDKVSTVFVKVVNVRRQEDGLWALGCKFLN